MDTSGKVFKQLVSVAPKPDLRDALYKVCENDFTQQKRATDVLALKNLQRAQEDLASTGSRKRKATQVCAGCARDFDEAENKAGCCQYYKYHPEPPEMDFEGDYWADTDLDSGFDESFEENPEGYRFPCCDGIGTHEGCAPYLHVANSQESATKSQRA